MVDVILGFVESRWRPFAVVFSFFLIGFINTMTIRLYHAGDLSRRSVFLVALLDSVAAGYLWRLGTRTSFYIQPRSRAVVFALSACGIGVLVAFMAET